MKWSNITAIFFIFIVISSLFIIADKIILPVVVATVAISLNVLFFHKKIFFQPNRQKIILLIFFLIFFPMPMYMIAFAAFAPAIIPLIFVSALTPIQTKYLGEVLLISGISFLMFSFLFFLNYSIVCYSYKIAKNKNNLWIIPILLLLLSFLKIYYFARVDGGRHIYNSIALIQEILGGQF